jgi:hypothetical protein
MPRLLALVVLVAVAACKPSVPAELTYQLRFAAEDVVPGLELQRDGVSVGRVSAAGTLEFKTPSAVRPTKLQLMALLPTPCGPLSAPLVLDVAAYMDDDASIAERMKSEKRLHLTAKLPPVGRTTLLVDQGDQPLMVGEAVIAPAPRTALFQKPGCAPTAPVKVGGEIIGTWRATQPVTFVSVPATCHKLTTLSFGDAVGGVAPTIFQQRVRGFDVAPDFFLTPAPSSVAARGAKARYLRELVATACPADPPPAEIARQALEHGGCLQAVVSLKRAVAWNDEDLESTTQLVRCLAESFSVREATELANATVKAKPEARGPLQEALVKAGHPEVALEP